MYYEVINNKKFNIPKSIFDWYLKKDNIDFNPRYQREGLVWKIKNKQLLIDSIINELDIPKFYFHLNINSNNPIVNESKKDYLYSIIDGKQRLNTIFEFIDNKWALSNNFEYFKDPTIDLSGLYYKDIAKQYPNIKVKFDNYIIDSVIIETNDIKMIHLLFLRLNSGISIKNPEIRKAMYGFISEEIERQILAHSFFINKIKIKNNFNEYFNLFSKFLVIEYSNITGKNVNLTKSYIDKFFTDNSEQNKILNNAFSLVNSNLNNMCEIFYDKDELLTKSNNIILYYLFISYYSPTNYDDIRSFISDFESLRKANKKLIQENTADSRLLEFDRLSQQGSTNMKSFYERLNIMQIFFSKWGINNLK
jgi:hypothetical protein